MNAARVAAEARAFLSLPAMPLPAGPDSYERTETARRLCGGAAAPSTAPMPRPICASGRSTAADSRRSAIVSRCSIATKAVCAASPRRSPPSETVLSIVTALPDTVAAAALSAGSLRAFAPPSGTVRLVIARDNDPEGERAAERLARRCARADVAALTVVPKGDDFNTDLVALGSAALRARLAPVFRYAGGRGRRASA